MTSAGVRELLVSELRSVPSRHTLPGSDDAGGTFVHCRVVADTQQTLYEAVGGMAFFEGLVDRFYEGVASDPVLLRLYPEPGDLAPARHRLTLFLAQYWGGPSTYNDERGHPRLRMRHMTFPIDQTARDRWLKYMLESIDEVGIDEPARTTMREYFERGSAFMINLFPLEKTDDGR